MNDNQIATLSNNFNQILRSWLAEEEMTQVVAFAKQNLGAHCCASHDYCDANVAMLEAVEKTYGLDPEEYDAEDYISQMNEAWAMSKASGFEVKS